MGFQFPDNCDNAKVPELSEASQSVVNSILSGGAFKNPFGDNLGGISDILNGPEGIGGQLTSLITQFDSVPDVKDVLGGIQSQLGLGLNAGGLLSQIDAFTSHSNMLSGVGDLSAFSERLGMAGALDSAKQAMGQGEGSFGAMFGSFENAGGMLNSASGQLGTLKSLLTQLSGGGLDSIDMDDLISLGGSLTGIGGNLTGQIDLDNAVLSGAKDLVQKMGIANMITTNNCYTKDLMNGMIGSNNLLPSLTTAVEERVGPDLSESEKESVEQSRAIAINEAKAAGIHSPALANIMGNNVVKSSQEINEVKSRPVFSPITVAKDSWSGGTAPHEVFLEQKQSTIIGSPIWYDGEWIQWFGYGNEFMINPDGTKERMRIKYDSPANGWIYRMSSDFAPLYKFFIQLLKWDATLEVWAVKMIKKDTPFGRISGPGGGRGSVTTAGGRSSNIPLPRYLQHPHLLYIDISAAWDKFPQAELAGGYQLGGYQLLESDLYINLYNPVL